MHSRWAFSFVAAQSKAGENNTWAMDRGVINFYILHKKYKFFRQNAYKNAKCL